MAITRPRPRQRDTDDEGDGAFSIVGYQMLVVQEEPVLRVFSADLPATATRLSLPVQFVQPRTDYKVEVLAIEAGGNQTLTELSFRSR